MTRTGSTSAGRRPARRLLAIASICLLELVARPRLARAEDAPSAGFGQRGTFVFLSPGVLAYAPATHDPIGLRYGLGVARYWRPRRRLGLSFGGHFEHWAKIESDGDHYDTLRLAAQLRVGGGGERWFAYGVAEVGFTAVLYNATAPEAHFRGADPGLGLLAGAGVMGLVTRVFFLGAEYGVNADILPIQYDDETALMSMQWRVLAGVLF